MEESWLEESSDGIRWTIVRIGTTPTQRFVRRSYKRTQTTIESTRPEDRGEQYAVPPKPPVFFVYEKPGTDSVRTSTWWEIRCEELRSDGHYDCGKYGMFTDEANAIEWCEYLNRTRGGSEQPWAKQLGEIYASLVRIEDKGLGSPYDNRVALVELRCDVEEMLSRVSGGKK